MAPRKNAWKKTIFLWTKTRKALYHVVKGTSTKPGKDFSIRSYFEHCSYCLVHKSSTLNASEKTTSGHEEDLQHFPLYSNDERVVGRVPRCCPPVLLDSPIAERSRLREAEVPS